MTAIKRCGWVVEWSEEDQCFVGSYPGIIGPCCHGDSEDEVYEQLRKIVDDWLEIEYEDRKRKANGQASSLSPYADRVKSHLAVYRRYRLGIEQEGIWDSKSYEHILPKELLWLNLIDTFRAEIRQYIAESGISLNQFFHHLNSLQAARLNLLWPLLNCAEPSLLVDTLGIGPGEVAHWEFEKVIDSNEKTSFDLYLELDSGTKVFIESKYTEEQFRSCKDDEQHRQKLREIYVPAMRDYVTPDYLKKGKFFANYQLLRNLAYIDPERNDKVVFLVPRANEKIVGQLQAVLKSAILDASVRSLVKIRYLEDVVSNAIALAGLPSGNLSLRTHLLFYREKYLI